MVSKAARSRAAKKAATNRKRNEAKRSKAAQKAAHTKMRNEVGRYPTALLCYSR